MQWTLLNPILPLSTSYLNLSEPHHGNLGVEDDDHSNQTIPNFALKSTLILSERPGNCKEIVLRFAGEA